jgi:hypothetical protein
LRQLARRIYTHGPEGPRNKLQLKTQNLHMNAHLRFSFVPAASFLPYLQAKERRSLAILLQG